MVAFLEQCVLVMFIQFEYGITSLNAKLVLHLMCKLINEYTVV